MSDQKQSKPDEDYVVSYTAYTRCSDEDYVVKYTAYTR